MGGSDYHIAVAVKSCAKKSCFATATSFQLYSNKAFKIYKNRMKKRLAVWVFFIMLSLALSLEPSFAPGLASGLMAQPGLGAASIAKGGVSLGEGDPLWALWNDPSGLIGARIGSVGELAKTTQAWNGLGFMVHRPFGLAELDQRVLSAVWSPRHHSDSVRTQA